MVTSVTTRLNKVLPKDMENLANFVVLSTRIGTIMPTRRLITDMHAAGPSTVNDSDSDDDSNDGVPDDFY